MARHLVEGCGAEDVARAQGLEQTGVVKHQPDLVSAGVAGHRGHAVAPMLRLHGLQAAFDLGVGLLPTGRFEASVAFDQWLTQAVGVFVQVFQRGALGADVALAEHIIGLAADAGHTALADLDFQAAAGLAQWADAVVGGGDRGGRACLCHGVRSVGS